MGILGKLTRAVVDTALTPVAIVKDVVTLGGLNTEQDTPYTAQQLKKIKEALGDAYDELAEDKGT